jgi:hypothetical protein
MLSIFLLYETTAIIVTTTQDYLRYLRQILLYLFTK